MPPVRVFLALGVVQMANVGRSACVIVDDPWHQDKQDKDTKTKEQR